ncbi:hypothetical protein BS329_28830 [Amycolatopsis coloradensis]|uniref:Uncharacterized protein n=1 Tax=Amycolatopsis coloradensis TaxID=76021 RepID=A0A1R0KMX8_9PSEU|nr:hypothetical protein [Amycolatopsis coloradensis]OLZ47969.1 hypothetical protein BS329_28830 [Amycolatopsis coloradensis]
MVDASKFTAEVYRRAAARPDAPPRLTRAADCVLDGKFSWEEVAAGTCPHPLAQALFTPKAQEKLWPLLAEVAAAAEPAPAPAEPRRARKPPPADDDFSGFTYLEDLAEPHRHPAWPPRPDPGR